MKVEVGKHYAGAQGPVRFVTSLGPSRWGTEYRYKPLLPSGEYGSERSCAISTMMGWAKREVDPNEDKNWISPLRLQAENVMIDLLDSEFFRTESARADGVTNFVALVVDAAKQELRKEFGKGE